MENLYPAVLVASTKGFSQVESNLTTHARAIDTFTSHSLYIATVWKSSPAARLVYLSMLASNLPLHLC